MKALRIFNGDHGESRLPKPESAEGGKGEEEVKVTIGKWDWKKKEWTKR